MRFAIVVAFVVSTLAACGGDDKSPPNVTDPTARAQRLLDKSAEALARVTSMHVEWKQTSARGASSGRAEISTSGDLRFMGEDAGKRFEVRIIGDEGWFRGNARAFRRANADAARSLTDTWVHMTSEQALTLAPGVDQFTPKLFARTLAETCGAMTVRGRERLDGKEVVVIEDAGDVPGTAPSRFYLAADSSLPLRFLQTGPRRPGRAPAACGLKPGTTPTSAGDTRFSAFNEPLRIKRPRAALELADLAGTIG